MTASDHEKSIRENEKFLPPQRPRTIAVDFDGTCCKWAFPACGEPRHGVIDTLKRLKDDGWEIIIHTCRVNSHWAEPDRTIKVGDMLRWLLQHEVPFDRIWGLEITNADWCQKIVMEELSEWYITERFKGAQLEWRYSSETGKPLADAYLDDRGVGFCRCVGDILVSGNSASALAIYIDQVEYQTVNNVDDDEEEDDDE
jgi:hypothetical protein